MTGERYRLPRLLYAGAILGGLSCIAIAGTIVNEWVRVALLTVSALHWLLLIDAIRSGVWVRDDGLDLRVPLQGGFRRVGWRDVERLERRPARRGVERLVLHLAEDHYLTLPSVRDQDALAAAIEAHVRA